MFNFDPLLTQLRKASRMTHAKWVNTLSLMEYMGARKILKSQRQQEIRLDLLTHVAEEIRHAQVLKKLALKLSHHQLHSYAPEMLLAGHSAQSYFQTLDHAVGDEIGKESSYLNYLLTTLFIEERAQALYPLYEPIMATLGHPQVLKNIAKEEDMHLKQVIDSVESQKGVVLLSPEQWIDLKMLEQVAFERWMQELVAALSEQTESVSVLPVQAHEGVVPVGIPTLSAAAQVEQS